MELWIKIIILWNVVGFLPFMMMKINTCRPYDDDIFLSPIWIYDEWNLNWFGTILVCSIFNLLCPIASVVFWTFKFVKFICTVGRQI